MSKLILPVAKRRENAACKRKKMNMGGKASRERGKRGERYVASRIRERLGLSARRGVQYSGGPDSPDVVGLPGFHIEVKNVNRLELHKAIAQSTDDAAEDEVPIVIHHRDREPWYVDMPFEAFLDLYAKANGI